MPWPETTPSLLPGCNPHLHHSLHHLAVISPAHAPGPVRLARGEPEEHARGEGLLSEMFETAEKFHIVLLRVRDRRQGTGHEDGFDDPAAAHHTMQVQKNPRGATRTGCSRSPLGSTGSF